MDIDRWLAFLAAALMIALLPGPGVANIVGFAVGSGRRTAFAAIGGAVTGSVVTMVMAMAGAGALLVASPRTYRVLEIGGALYLMSLGVLAWRDAESRRAVGVPRIGVAPWAAYLASIAVSATNPKSILFFVGFTPQFVDPARDYVVQCAMMIGTFAAVIGVTDTIYALVSIGMVGVLRSTSAMTNIRRASGLVMVVIGVTALVIR